MFGRKIVVPSLNSTLNKQMFSWFLVVIAWLNLLFPLMSHAISYDDILALRMEVKSIGTQVHHHETDFSLLYDRLKDLENAQEAFEELLHNHQRKCSSDSSSQKLLAYDKELNRIKELTNQMHMMLLSHTSKIEMIEKQLNKDVNYLKHSLETILFHLGASSSDSNKVTYTVKPGDTLSSIACTKKISINQLKQQNGLSSDKIFPGQILKIS